MSFSLFTKSSARNQGLTKNGEELCLVIGIESGLVRGSLVLFSRLSSSATVAGPGIPPRIFHTVSAEIASREGVHILSSMLDAVSLVSEDLLQKGLKIAVARSITIPISKIHVVLSSPWIISKTKTVKVSYEKETEITKAAINAIVDGGRRELEQKFTEEHDNSLEFDLAFIEQKIFEVKLNGYPTVHYEGKSARDLEVSFAISISSKKILESVEKTVTKFVRIPARNVEYHSSLLLQYSALRNIIPATEAYIIVHAHNEISDVIVVNRGITAALASFPSGTATVSQTSAAHLKQSKEMAHSALNLQSKNALNPAEHHRVQKIADISVEAWAQKFKETLASVGQTDFMPHRVYLLANRHYPHFERALAAVAPANTFTVVPIEKSVVDAAVSHENREREDALMSLYVFALR